MAAPFAHAAASLIAPVEASDTGPTSTGYVIPPDFLSGGLVVDNFAGGGGASEGVQEALDQLWRDGWLPARQYVDVALNHDAPACAMYAANHPHTTVLCQSVFKADPRQVVREASRRRGSSRPLPVALAWFSPDCTDHSKAKGGAPIRKRHSRDLAWVIPHWAKLVGPAVILMENVEEWLQWGPVRQRRWPEGTAQAGELMFDLHGDPVLERDPTRAGEFFQKWCAAMRRRGYRLAWKEIRACDDGAPTIRKRLFLVAVRDRLPIEFQQHRYGDPKSEAVKAGQKLPYRTAAECIDWSLPCPSIFLTKEEARKIGCKRPLASASNRRIARGVMRWTVLHERPFIVPITHQGDARVHAIDEPVRTLTTANRGELALAQPFFAGPFFAGVGGRMGQSGERPVTPPYHTTTGKADTVLVAGFLKPRYGERPGQDPRSLPITGTMPTPVPGGNGGDLVAAFLAEFRGDSIGQPADAPAPTVTANSFDKRPGGAPPVAVVEAQLGAAAVHVTNFNENGDGRPAEDPLGTAIAGATRFGAVAAFMAQNNTGCDGHTMDETVSTIVTKGCTQAVVASHLINLKGSDRRDGPADGPAPAQCAGGTHVGVVYAFLAKYHGTGGQDSGADRPLRTADTHGRFGLVTVAAVEAPQISDEDRYKAWWVARFLEDEEQLPRHTLPIDGPRGSMVLVKGMPMIDIGMRMLVARELFNAQGFRRDYKIDPLVPDKKGRLKKLSATEQIHKCGNSVSPPPARALALAILLPRLKAARAAAVQQQAGD